jgi:phosphoribosylanthranilate isomerase
MIIKVCGMKEDQNILGLDKLQPDFIGLIFYEKSPRFIGENPIPKTNAKKVGVFVNSSLEEIIFQAQKLDFNYVQLHGDEDISLAKSLQEKGYKVIKNFSIADKIDNEVMKIWQPFCEYFLFDTKGKSYGGTGEKFNWNILENYNLETPFILSGGIAPEDVSEIKKNKHKAFAGIDLNSKFEIAPGIKNIEKLKLFIDEIRK